LIKVSVNTFGSTMMNVKNDFNFGESFNQSHDCAVMLTSLTYPGIITLVRKSYFVMSLGIG
jgi:hypothetical protein